MKKWKEKERWEIEWKRRAKKEREEKERTKQKKQHKDPKERKIAETVEKFYQILDIKTTDSLTYSIINKAYKKQALKWHPDKNLNNAKISENNMKDINNARDALKATLRNLDN